MRPDTAAAFDQLAAAAQKAGVLLSITSGFRPDAEQAKLFAAHPDPKWVARPGQSLHRNGTELDLGPASAYTWLEQNAARFGFVTRYGWETVAVRHFFALFQPRETPATARPVGAAKGRPCKCRPRTVHGGRRFQAATTRG